MARGEDTVVGVQAPAGPPGVRETHVMPPVDTDRNLLFGLLALQNGLIDQAKLVAAFQAWTLEKARPLAEHLVARGDLDDDDRSAVEALVARHLKKHGGSTEKSLAAIPAGPSTRRACSELPTRRFMPAWLSSGPETDGEGVLARIAERTGALTCITLAEPEPGSEPPLAHHDEGLIDGAAGRYQVLGEIARGGMGAVLRGRDPDLGRDLALEGPARPASRPVRPGRPVRRGGADLRPAPASRGGAGLRAGHARRPPARSSP